MIDAGLVRALGQRLESILRRHPAGLSEHELFVLLQADEHPVFDPGVFADSLALFRAHFLLFHTLYRLSDQLTAEGRGRVRVEPLRIVLEPDASPPGAALDRADPLRAYYLDPQHLEHTTRADVESMLGRFWTRLHADENRQQALAILDLREPVDFPAIRRRYRQLVMEHHPDRGGDTARLQRINDAMAILARLYAR